MPLIYQMSDIVKAEGDDYSCYSADSKKIIASCASVAVSIKSVLDTPLLTDDGLLTDASEGTATNIEGSGIFVFHKLLFSDVTLF